MNNSKKTVDHIIINLQQIFQKTGKKNAVIAVSGGIDSAVSLTLTVLALGNEHVYPLLLPYGESHAHSLSDGKKIVEFNHIPKQQQEVVSIKPFADSIFEADSTMDSLRKGNIMARTRMLILFDRAKKHDALVVGTENKSEHYLGYYTRFGDEASDVEPLRELFKTDVYKLAHYLDIPADIIEKAPTAGLWEGQTDEKEFGFSYTDADTVLSLLLEQNKPIEEVISTVGNKDTVLRVVERVENNKFKQKLPFIIGV